MFYQRKKQNISSKNYWNNSFNIYKRNRRSSTEQSPTNFQFKRLNKKCLKTGIKSYINRTTSSTNYPFRGKARIIRVFHNPDEYNLKQQYQDKVNAGKRSAKRRFSLSEAGSTTGIDQLVFKQKMANTLSVMTNVLRNVVSKQRIRYKEKGFNLDLAYVCDNIIAMGYPAEKYESIFRNRLEDVYKFLEENHHDHYKIYNLCLERSYDINKFHGRVSVYPFEDHNPPTIELIQKFCEDVDTWLKTDNLNVAAVHCKAGKGRTGTMICCYLLYSGQQLSAEDALSCYDEKRTKDRKGVTIPSQRRYVQYFSKLIRLGLPYERRTLQFCEIRFSEAPILQSQGSVHCSISVLQETVHQLQNLLIDFRKSYLLDMKSHPLPVAGDIKVELTKNNKKIFHFWFNTFFVTDAADVEGEGKDVKLVYVLHKSEIDDVHKDKEHKCFSEDFKVELVFFVDDHAIGQNRMNLSSSNPLDRHAIANTVRLPTAPPITQQQTNNYSLPQNNSSGSEMNFLCDQQKSSSSTSVSSSLCGGSGTDNSNNGGGVGGGGGGGGVGVFDIKRSAQQQQQLQHFYGSSCHHQPYLVMDNNHLPPPTTATLPPNYNEILQTQLHINNKQHQQSPQKQQELHIVKGSLIPPPSSQNQRNTQRHNEGGSTVGTAGAAKDFNALLTDYPPMKMDLYQPSANNSSKTSSVSSQSSSSAIGDNEEDWESDTTNSRNAARKSPTLAAASEIDGENLKGESVQTKVAVGKNKFQIGHKSLKQIKQQQQLQQCNIKQSSNNSTTKTTSETSPTSASAAAAATAATKAKTATTQMCHTCLKTGDISSELKCC